MLLAASAGQAAPYTSYESSATRKISNNTINNNNINANNVRSGTSSSPTPPPPPHSTATATSAGSVATGARPTTASSIASTAACAIMKTLSVRLHRGTEFIKDTVQKALVMSATTPVVVQQGQALDKSQNQNPTLKRKLTGAGGIINSGSGMGSGLGSSRPFPVSQPYVVPTPAFLRRFTVAPLALHRSASARKRNPSTDSLLMDLCIFKPIRPMPITPIKINKARGFELKRPKFMPPITNMYSDTDEDDDEDNGDGDDEQELDFEATKTVTEVAYKPKLSTLILPQHATTSAFVPHEATNWSTITDAQASAHTNDNTVNINVNTHTSDSEISAAPVLAVASASTSASATTACTSKPKPAIATKRRRRAPLLTSKRHRKTATANKDAEPSTAAIATVAPVAPAPAPANAPKRRRRNADAITVETAASGTIISPMRRSPPMTRQRARQQISASRK
ncbi:hypothetical protein KR044_005696 [Drosophila immigrans]|nr:hypothetical protein KR044_005696 [Drosophila immigrans]